ncbi:MAG: CAP domain-containing protein [Planctomycetes bacterium]|nr:CAP domain-containing protein [Planctomycetota bacterium]
MAIVCALVVSGDPDASIQAIAREAHSTDPEKRTRAYAELLAAGDSGKLVLRDLLTAKEKHDAEAIESFPKTPAFASLRQRLRKEIVERRAAALSIIHDTGRYPDDAHGAVGQPEVSARVGELREVYDRPTFWLRSRVPDVESLLAPIDENHRFSESVGVAKGRFADVMEAMAFLDDQFDTRSLAMEKEKKAWEEILEYNDSVATSATEIEREAIRLTNEYRILMGVLPVEIDERLLVAARKHSEEMAERGYFAHESPVEANKTPGARVHHEGYSGGVAENIAEDSSAESAVDGWCHSSGHHRNLIAAGHRQIGLGVAADKKGHLYFTQDFGAGASLRGRRIQDPRMLYAERLKKIKDGDAAAYFSLAQWCRTHKLDDESKAELQKVIEIDPEHEAARRQLGFTKVDGAWVTREEKAAHAVTTGDGDLGPLGARLHDKDAAARRRAIAELSRIGGGNAARVVATALDDEASEVRADAARALAALKEKQTIPALKRAIAAKDRDFFARHAIAAALFTLGEGDGVEGLLLDLRSTSNDVRGDAGDTLRAISGQDFGYRWDLPDADREAAARRYDDWWKARTKS